MTYAHLHLLLNHLPVFGSLFGLLLIAYAFFKRSSEATQLALVVFVLSGVAAVGAYFTGEPAEDGVEHVAGVSRAAIHQHEDFALIAFVAAIILGVVSLGGLWLSRRQVPRWLSALTLVLALVTTGLMAWTAELGGLIRHPEIRKNGLTNQQDTRVPAGQGRTQREDEDDD